VYWERSPCVPPAIFRGVVESANGAAQAPVPPPLTVALLQLTVTAETGTVGQFENVAAAACAVNVQEALLPAKLHQLTAAAELPGSDGESGSFAEKLTVAGLTVKSNTGPAAVPTALGRGRIGFTITPRPGTAAKRRIAESQPMADQVTLIVNVTVAV